MIAHIGGSGTWGNKFPEDLGDPDIELADQRQYPTSVGDSPPLSRYRYGTREFLHTPFHGYFTNDRLRDAEALFIALKDLGVGAIIVDASVGALNPLLEVGDIVLPHDVMDFRTSRLSYSSPIAGVRNTVLMAKPFDPELRDYVLGKAQAHFPRVFRRATTVCVEGARFESPAESRFFRNAGGDVIGMTVCPEVELAHAIGARIGVVNVVSNAAEGIEDEAVNPEDMVSAYRGFAKSIGTLLLDVIRNLPEEMIAPREPDVARMGDIGGDAGSLLEEATASWGADT